jgi:hypothetical protein
MPSTHTTPKPKGLLRRMERFMVGLVMSLMAFVLERVVMRSIRREGGEPKHPTVDATSITTKGGEIEFEPDR